MFSMLSFTIWWILVYISMPICVDVVTGSICSRTSLELTDVQLVMWLDEQQHCYCYLQMEMALLGQHHRIPDHWDPRLVAHVLRGSPCLACHSTISDMETNGLLSSPCDGWKPPCIRGVQSLFVRWKSSAVQIDPLGYQCRATPYLPMHKTRDRTDGIHTWKLPSRVFQSWFLVEGPAIKLPLPSPPASTMASQTCTFSTP